MQLILVDLISGGGEDLTGSDNTTAEGVLSLLTSTVMDCALDKSPGFFAPDNAIVFLLDGRGRKDRGARAMIGQVICWLKGSWFGTKIKGKLFHPSRYLMTSTSRDMRRPLLPNWLMAVEVTQPFLCSPR